LIPGFGGTSTFAKPAGAFGGFGATTNQPAPTSFGGFGATPQPAGTTGFSQAAVAGPSNAGFGGFGGTTGGGWGNAGATQPTGFTGMRSIHHTYAQVLIRLLAALTGTGQGTANPVYQAFTERDPQAAGTTLHYQTISCMGAYKNYSLDELRLQDYQANRKTASAAPGFSQQQQPTGFGATGAGFGQTTNQPSSSGFGAFSAAKPAGTGLFGQTTQNTSTGFGGFSSNSAATSGSGLFGQNAQQPATTAFGQQQQPTSTFGAFSQNTQNTGAGFGTFGQNNQNKPYGGGFGAFESGAKYYTLTVITLGQTQPTTAGFGAFGQQNQSQPTTGFGQTQQPATTGFSGFSANTSNQPKPGGLFGGFGQTQQATTGFGQPAQQQPATGGFGTNAFGGFGLNNNNQQQQQPPTGGGESFRMSSILQSHPFR
jgi:nuclear pore complex protein Nup98-Nup96